jgi:hypothetical protein
MNAQLLYIGSPTSAVEPVIQVTNGGKAVITSIRVCTPTNSNGTYEIHHLRYGQTAATTGNALAFNIAITSKQSVEFLTHPLPLSPGEALWVSGSNVTMAVYGIVL